MSTSRIRGTFVSVTGSLVSRQAARIGSAPFLFPAARTVPERRWPPSMRNDSISAGATAASGTGVATQDGNPTREEAWDTLTRYTKSESLLRHARAVEASTRWYARHFGEDEEAWGATALLHDFDYEIHPTLDKHPQDGAAILREEGYPEWSIEAVLSHAEHLAMARDTQLKKTLFACDELSGSCTPAGSCARTASRAWSRSRSKKLKQPSFAAGVHRDEVYAGAELLGLELDEHIATSSTRCSRSPASSGSGPVPANQAPWTQRRPSSSLRRSSSLVHQPVDARMRPEPGISRTTTSAAASRCTVWVGSPGGRNETSVAWSGAVTTSTPASSSSSRRRCASRAPGRSAIPAGR